MPDFKKLYFFVIVSLSSLSVFSQDFYADWKAFVPPNNWKIEFIKDSTFNFNKKVVGKLVLQNELDPQFAIEYQIFNSLEIDSLFKEHIKQHQILSPCVTNINFSAFAYKGYYYLPDGCNACNTNRIGGYKVNNKNKYGNLMTNCEHLNATILKFTTLKY